MRIGGRGWPRPLGDGGIVRPARGFMALLVPFRRFRLLCLLRPGRRLAGRQARPGGRRPGRAAEGRAGPLLRAGRLCRRGPAVRSARRRQVEDTRFEHLLFENFAFGNTVVMNAAARALIVSALPQTGAIMHDWWCALVTAAFGTVIHDSRPATLYRQHDANVVGASAGRLGEIRRHLARFLRDPRGFYPIHGQAAELLRRFGPRLPPARRAPAEAPSPPAGRWPDVCASPWSAR